MKSPRDFLVEPLGGDRYNNTSTVNGNTFTVNTYEENHKASNRQAVVIETPAHYEGPIKKGDILLVHHNVFKFYNDMRGNKRSGKSFFRDGQYLVDYEQFFMYKNENGWNPYDRYCFVKPIENDGSIPYFTGEYLPLQGTMMYPNEYLLSKDVKKNDRVLFQPDSEYEFDVDGELMYRIYDHRIVAVL